MTTIRNRILQATLSLLCAAPLSAQQPGGSQPPPTTQMVLKGKAPVSDKVLKVKLPVPKETTLPNGLRLMVLEDHRVPEVSFQLMIPARVATTIRRTAPVSRRGPRR